MIGEFLVIVIGLAVVAVVLIRAMRDDQWDAPRTHVEARSHVRLVDGEAS